MALMQRHAVSSQVEVESVQPLRSVDGCVHVDEVSAVVADGQQPAPAGFGHHPVDRDLPCTDPCGIGHGAHKGRLHSAHVVVEVVGGRVEGDNRRDAFCVGAEEARVTLALQEGVAPCARVRVPRAGLDRGGIAAVGVGGAQGAV